MYAYSHTYMLIHTYKYTREFTFTMMIEDNLLVAKTETDRCREEMLFIGIQKEDQVWSPAQLSPLKDTLRQCLFSWYAFLCFNGLENFDIFYIRHNNIHGNDLLDSSVENLHRCGRTSSSSEVTMGLWCDLLGWVFDVIYSSHRVRDQDESRTPVS